jgi:UDP-N-acetyl-2-amino-2-deoxyglucuronate dehydrogenase
MSYRFAIIGCGNIAVRHAEHIQSCAKLVAVCDIIPDRAEVLGNRYQANVYSDHHELLKKENPDVVVICTPNGLHAEQASDSLLHGAHVLCEKPMVINVNDGKKLVATALHAGKKLFVVKQNRFNPPVLAVKQLLHERKLGKITGFHINCAWNRPKAYYDNSWRGSLQLDGGILFTQFSHFIDILYWFLGDIRQVAGWRANLNHTGVIEFEDTGAASIVMQSGAIGSINYTINAYGSNMEGSFTLFGEKGTVKIGGRYLNTLDYFSVENETAPVIPPRSSNNYGFYKGSMSNHGKVYEELIKALDDPFYKFLEAHEALKSVEMIEQIYSASPFVKIHP